MGVPIQNYIIGAFKPPCDISITFSDARTRKQVQFFISSCCYLLGFKLEFCL